MAKKTTKVRSLQTVLLKRGDPVLVETDSPIDEWGVVSRIVDGVPVITLLGSDEDEGEDCYEMPEKLQKIEWRKVKGIDIGKIGLKKMEDD